MKRRPFFFRNRKSEAIFIIGGARSGKSAYAEDIAKERGRERVLFIATAEALDDEMRARIAKHRAARPPAWVTMEAPRELTLAISQLEVAPQLIVLDCVTLWVTNEMLADETDLEKRVLGQLDLIMEWAHMHDIDMIIVSNEVGYGIVPDNALARRFRDVLGHVNAYIAHHCDEVYWMVAGLPIEVKRLAQI